MPNAVLLGLLGFVLAFHAVSRMVLKSSIAGLKRSVASWSGRAKENLNRALIAEQRAEALARELGSVKRRYMDIEDVLEEYAVTNEVS